MDITPRIAAQSAILQSYANGGFKVSGTSYTGAVCVFAGQVSMISSIDLQSEHAPAQLADIVTTHAKMAEIILLGTGATLPPVLPVWIRRARQTFGVPMDMMDTPAACRTYNVLLTEGRGVAALLLPVMPQS